MVVFISFFCFLSFSYSVQADLDKKISSMESITIYEPTSSSVWDAWDSTPKTIRWSTTQNGVDIYLYKGSNLVQNLGYYRKGVTVANFILSSSLRPGTDYCIKIQEFFGGNEIGWSDYFKIVCQSSNAGDGGDSDDSSIGTTSLRDICIHGNHAFMVDSLDGLVIIDISDPTNPGESSYYSLGGNHANKLYVDQKYAYISCGLAIYPSEYQGLAVIDISDPTNPKSPVYIDIDGPANDVWISGQYAFISSSNNDNKGLYIINIEDLANPGTPVFQSVSDWVFDVVIKDNVAFLATSDAGVAMIDISDPSSPSEPIYILDDLENVWHLSLQGDKLYVLADRSAMVDVTKASSPSLPVYIDLCVNDIETEGNIAFIGHSTKVEIYDISSLSDPILLGTKATQGIAKSLELVGNYLYVADDAGGLKIFYIGDYFSNDSTSNLTGNISSTPSTDFQLVIFILSIIIFQRKVKKDK